MDERDNWVWSETGETLAERQVRLRQLAERMAHGREKYAAIVRASRERAEKRNAEAPDAAPVPRPSRPVTGPVSALRELLREFWFRAFSAR